MISLHQIRVWGSLALVLAAPAALQAAVLAQWNFETNTPADLTNSAVGPSVSAEVGTGTLHGVHVSANSDWTTPAGPGSANSYSVNEWSVSGETTGNYFEFSTSSAGHQDLLVQFDATGSNTGPRNFKIAYSTDGSTFTDFGTYALVNAGWSAANPPLDPSTSHFSFDFSSVPALNDQATVAFRLIQVDSTAISGTMGTGGTSRIDNVTIEAALIPEPASLGLLAGAAMVVAGRRRRA